MSVDISDLVVEIERRVRVDALEKIEAAFGVKGRKAAVRIPDGETALSWIEKNPGSSVTEISAALGYDAKPEVAGLLAERKIKRKGVKRGTRYYPR